MNTNKTLEQRINRVQNEVNEKFTSDNNDGVIFGNNIIGSKIRVKSKSKIDNGNQRNIAISIKNKKGKFRKKPKNNEGYKKFSAIIVMWVIVFIAEIFHDLDLIYLGISLHLL